MSYRRTLLICVDCSDEELRTQINSAILRIGYRVQYSVFIVVGTRVLLEELHRDLSRYAQQLTAHIVVIDLGSPSRSVQRMTEYGTPYGSNRSAVESAQIPDIWLF